MCQATLHHLASTGKPQLSWTRKKHPFRPLPHFSPTLGTRNWEKAQPSSLCQFPNELLTWLLRPSKTSLPLVSTSLNLWLWMTSFSGVPLLLPACPCLHLQNQEELYMSDRCLWFDCELLKDKDYTWELSKKWCLIPFFGLPWWCSG